MKRKKCKKVKKLSKKRQLKKLKNLAHKLWREYILSKFSNKCVICSSKIKPNCHHLISEQMFTSLRYLPDNGIVLCSSHHKFNKFSAHKNAIWFVRVVLPQVMAEAALQLLMDKMMKVSTQSKFVWTIELYNEAIENLKNSIKRLRGNCDDNTTDMG